MNVVDKLLKQGNGVFEEAKAYFEIGIRFKLIPPLILWRSAGTPFDPDIEQC